jgi:hypothetical protein
MISIWFYWWHFCHNWFILRFSLSGFVGCYKDQWARTLKRKKTNSRHMTFEKCRSICTDKKVNSQYFGMEVSFITHSFVSQNLHSQKNLMVVYVLSSLSKCLLMIKWVSHLLIHEVHITLFSILYDDLKKQSVSGSIAKFSFISIRVEWKWVSLWWFSDKESVEKWRWMH